MLQSDRRSIAALFVDRELLNKMPSLTLLMLLVLLIDNLLYPIKSFRLPIDPKPCALFNGFKIHNAAFFLLVKLLGSHVLSDEVPVAVWGLLQTNQLCT